jgi:hypothetical protein
MIVDGANAQAYKSPQYAHTDVQQLKFLPGRSLRLKRSRPLATVLPCHRPRRGVAALPFFDVEVESGQPVVLRHTYLYWSAE